jgi:3-oxoacyl-[acyl-carrier protein] reductase
MVLTRDAVSLAGRVAVVTGGGSGIGRGIATAFAEFGARVAVWEREQAPASSAAAEARGLACVTDVREAGQVDAALSTTIEKLGVPTILVNNAGGVFSSALLDTSVNGWDALIRSNLSHVLLCTQRVARAMVAAGQGGSIINLTSIEGFRAAPGYAAYAAAKAGVVNFTKTAALELAPHRIRVNGIAPDVTLTEGIQGLAPQRSDAAGLAAPDFQERTSMMIPMGRLGHVDETAGAALFFACELSSYVTGQTLHVDGGTAAAAGWYHDPSDGHYILGPPTSART